MQSSPSTVLAGLSTLRSTMSIEYLAHKGDSGLGLFFGSKMLNEETIILRRKRLDMLFFKLEIKGFPTLS